MSQNPSDPLGGSSPSISRSTFGDYADVQLGNRNVDQRVTNNYYSGDPLQLLPYAANASFNASGKEDDPVCLPDTRVEVLKCIRAWTDGDDKRHIFWLSGWAGAGKSTIARTVAREHYDKNRLGASFFFSRGGGDVSHAAKFVGTVAVQLAHKSPDFKVLLQKVISEDQGIVQRVLRDQWRELIIGPLSRLEAGSLPSPLIIVVDALDECDRESDIKHVLQLLADTRGLDPVHLRVLVTSRPEIPIRDGFSRFPNDKHHDLVLHNITEFVVDRDISVFLKHHLSMIRPEERIIEQLVRKASGLFIWAATACRFVNEGKRFAAKRLFMILESSSTAITEPEKHLNEVYITVLKNSISPDYTNEEKEESCRILRHSLGSIVVLLSPLSSHSLSRLLDVRENDVDQTLEDLHAILDIPNDQTRPLRLHHPSFRDFLLDKERCGDLNFWVDEKQAHRTLAESCVRLMSTLEQDICGLSAPGVLVTDVKSSRVDERLPPEVQYACLYWVQHLQKGDVQFHDDGQVHQFLQIHLLHWLEALSWMRRVSEGIYAITSLESIAPMRDCPRLSKFVHDIKRFVLYNRTVIEQAPLQTYCSALIFAPTMSIVRNQFKDCMPQWMRRLPEVDKNWNAVLQTLEGHLGPVGGVAFSPDGKLVVSGSNDRTIKLWDATTGALQQTLEGHSGFVWGVAFSPDGKLVVSGSDDRTVKLWDATTGALQRTVEGHSGSVYAVAFSPGGKLVASCSTDGTIKLWDVATGALQQKAHSGPVYAVAFSPDGNLVASGSNDRTIMLWDAATGALQQTLEGHSGYVGGLAFSPDGKLLASGSNDRTMKLWNAATGALQQTLEGHSDRLWTVAFSPDGKRVASGSADRTIKLWDATTGALQQTLEGHSDGLWTVAFSPDGKLVASGSLDGTIKLWDAVTGAQQTLEGHSDRPFLVAFSPDGKLVASGSLDGRIKLWDATTGALQQTLGGHSGHVWAVAFSPDGKLVVSGSNDGTIKLWDAVTGALQQTLEGHLDPVWAVAFSPDGKLVASGSINRTIRTWEAQTAAFYPDGKLATSGSDDGTIRLWDAATGALQQTLEGHSDLIWAVAFSPDGKLVASGSDDGTIKLWDAVTGALQQTLEVDAGIRRLSFSKFGPYLEMDRGLLRFQTTHFGILPQQSELISDIFVKERWVARDMEKLLWLPPDYRPRHAAVYGRVVALGHVSGRVLILEFSF